MSNLDGLAKFEHYLELFDFYESLFTEKQKEYFKSYYHFDLSLSEISENYQITRSAVFDTINKMQKALDKFEENLLLVKKHNERKSLLKMLEEALPNNIEVALKLIEKLKEIE